MHPDDDEAVAAVAGDPRLEVGQRAQAVDAGVGPEVDEHDLAAQGPEAQRLAAGRVEPALVAREVRSGAQARQARPLDALAPGGRDREARRAAQVVEPAGDGVRGLEPARRVDEPRGQVVGDGRLEAHVEVRRHGHAGEDEDGGQRALQARPAPRGAHAPGEGAPAERQRQEDERGAQREREADGHRARRRGPTAMTAARIGPARGRRRSPVRRRRAGQRRSRRRGCAGPGATTAPGAPPGARPATAPPPRRRSR